MALVAADTDVLFAEIGKALFASNLNNTANKTVGTIAAETEDFLQQVGLDASSRSTAILDAVAGAAKATAPLASAALSYNTTVTQTPVQNLVVQVVKADSQQPNDSALTAIRELTRQMLVMSPVETLKANEPIASTVVYGTDFNATSASSANTGDGILTASTKRGDGKVNEHLLPEAIEGNVSSITATGQASFQLKGELSVSKMSPDWPGGSGITTTLTSYVGASGANLVNGSFEVANTNEADLASGWSVVLADDSDGPLPGTVPGTTVGTTLNLTPIEVQTVVIGGTPTGGWYTLTHVDKDGNKETTLPLVFNASGSAVQSALRSLAGLGELTVSTTGTLPDFTHTITFTGVTNPGTLTSNLANLTGGTPTITHAVTTASSASVMRGARAISFTGNAAGEMTAISHPVTLSPATVYCCSVWVKNDGAVAAGTLNIDLVSNTGEGQRQVYTTAGFAGDDKIDVTAHGFSDGDRVHVATTGTLSTGLTAGILYFVVNKTTNDFEVSTTFGGGAVGISSAGAGTQFVHLVPPTVSDDLSVGNELTIDLTTDFSTYTHQTAFFRTPTILPDATFLRIHVVAKITSGEDIFLDELCFVPATELYPGGPFAAIFTGPTLWVDTDVLRFSPANGQIGLIHTWMDRIFDLSNNRLLLSSTTGAETILDSLIS